MDCGGSSPSASRMMDGVRVVIVRRGAKANGDGALVAYIDGE